MFDRENIPQHIAVIMDGNGRWAKAHSKPRSAGHKAGVKAVHDLIEEANDLGVSYLTIYSFSTENWARPKQEVDSLMRLFAKTMREEIDAMDEKGVRIRLIGNIQGLAAPTREVYLEAVERTKHNTGMQLVIAANYGARQSIVDAAKTFAADAASVFLSCGGAGLEHSSGGDFGIMTYQQAADYLKRTIDTLTPETFAMYLDTGDIPDPDLLIRTSGERRLSNFLLYELAYTELYISEKYWPDFGKADLRAAIEDYQGRERRYGGVEQAQ
ncbi:MAG: di-trans,poly-cis-decaprenylcistransferase [Coriobacteriales bacterium]|jgi:undecaprenyl diphosphate synthase|nr:di-trans,poly-cis-decaprenylcistransferase [Coriobacteriales bacterium]